MPEDHAFSPDGRGTAGAEDAQRTPTRSHISASILQCTKKNVWAEKDASESGAPRMIDPKRAPLTPTPRVPLGRSCPTLISVEGDAIHASIGLILGALGMIRLKEGTREEKILSSVTYLESHIT